MREFDCGAVREIIPELAGDRLEAEARGPIEEHLVACDDCRAELELARALYASRATAPPGLAERVIDTVRRDRRSLHRPWWAISAAAVAALALGIGITSGPAGQGGDLGTTDVALETEETELWLSDDGVLAGAPLLETLSDEALTALLEEMTPATTGGQA